MSAFTPAATAILAAMEPDRPYGVDDLRAFVPDASVERLRELMHELWVSRQVERVGYSSWRRQPSASTEHRPASGGDVRVVTPEELFDHDTFADFFK
jgi:hypothetical protein